MHRVTELSWTSSPVSSPLSLGDSESPSGVIGPTPVSSRDCFNLEIFQLKYIFDKKYNIFGFFKYSTNITFYLFIKYLGSQNIFDLTNLFLGLAMGPLV